MIKMICFDLDGTIIDTLHSIAYSCNLALENHGYKTYPDKEYINFIGNGMTELVLRAMHIKEKNEDFEAVRKEYQDNYTKYQISEAKPFLNMFSTILELKRKGYLVSCISNKPDLDVKNMVEHFFPKMFDYIAGFRDDVIPKPNRLHIDMMRDQFGLSEDEVMYVGDSHVDYEFALNANVKLILALYGYDKREVLLGYKNVYGYIESPKELLRYFE